MNDGVITFLGLRIPRMPKPDPMRVAWYAQVPAAAVMFAAALSPVRLPTAVIGLGIAACAVGAASVAVAWRRRQISSFATSAAATTFVQALLNVVVFVSMPFRSAGPTMESRVLWGVCAVVLVVTSAFTLSTWRR